MHGEHPGGDGACRGHDALPGQEAPRPSKSLASGEWKRSRFLGRQLSGKRLLVVGLGRIGTQVAARCRAFGMEASAYDPYVSPAKADRAGVRLMEDLKGALSLADVVTLHVPLTAETQEYHRRGGYKSLQLGGLPGQLRQGRAHR